MYQYQVSFGDAIKRAFSNYCVFTGRASRSEFWWFMLLTYIVSWALAIPSTVDSIAMLNAVASDPSAIAEMDPSFGVSYYISMLWSLAIFLPQLGLFFRRLHDTGRSGWNWLWSFLPVIGWIILIVYFCKESEPVTNKYGEVPNLR